jgi:predicted  nucleic acid-binding Zn-ribbon protein
MRTSILVVMLDFLVCSLLLFVIGTGGENTQLETSAPKMPAVHQEFTPAAMQAQQEEWNRDYEQQSLLTRLNTASSENQQLRSRLNETTATLAQQQANLKAVTEEKAQTEKALSGVQQQLTRVSEERQKAQQEGEAAKESLAKLQSEEAKLQQERSQLTQQAQQLGQTVASQQATISTLSQQVLSSQERVESQLTDVAKGQQEMGTTLAQLDVFARTLPATIQKNVSGVHDEQQAMQQDLAAMAENVKGLQSELNGDEKGGLGQAMEDIAKGQQDLQSKLDALMKSGQGDQIAQSLNAIEAGQDALRQQTAKLGTQIESIKARGPGPYKAVKGARLGLQVAIAETDSSKDYPISHFRSTAYPPAVNVGGRSFVVANGQTLGFTWWALDSDSEITQLKYTVNRVGDTPWSGALTGPACALRADPHVVAVEMSQPPPGASTMELAGPDAIVQNDQHRLYVFKSTAAGLSFEIDTAPDLADARYLVVKRAMRGVAAWFENPAYRADTGDYVVTSDGKLVGIMVSRERCFILTKDNLTNCALSVPLTDGRQFLRAVSQFRKLK